MSSREKENGNNFLKERTFHHKYACHQCSCFIPEKGKITWLFSKNIKRSSTKLTNIRCYKFPIPEIRNIPEKGHHCTKQFQRLQLVKPSVTAHKSNKWKRDLENNFSHYYRNLVCCLLKLWLGFRLYG